MKQLLQANFAPPGGWRFVDPDTGFKFKKRYRSLEELVAHVTSYRKQNGLSEIPKLSFVIEDWLCAQPNMAGRCKEVKIPSRTFAQYVKGAKSAAKMLIQGNDAFVDDEVAEARAALCVKCRHNKKNEQHSKLERYTDKYVKDIVGEKTTSVDEQLFSCEVCTCPLRPKVHISQKIIEESLSKKERRLLSMGLWDINGKIFDCWQVKPVLTVLQREKNATD